MIQKPRGTEDIFGKKAKEILALNMIIRKNMELFNYDEIKTPIFENIELFKRGVGEDTDVVSKEMFVFFDKKNREFALRPEGTAPVVRSVVENKLYIQENLPLKLFYIGEMFRYERPQNGRNRQFNQLGIEAFGPKSPEIDCEIILNAVNVLNLVGIENIICHINYLVDEKQRENYIVDLKKYLSSKKLCDDCKVRIKTNPLRVLDCKIDSNQFDDVLDMNEYLTDDQKKYYKKLLFNLDNTGVKYTKDKMLVRGLDYYTGFVFEIKLVDKNQKSTTTIVGGGRYDKLVKQLDGPDLSSAGYGMGLERVLIALEDNKIVLSNEKVLDAYIISISEKAKGFSNILLAMLRKSGVTCDTDYMNRSFKSVFKQVEKNNANHVIIIGDNELKENVVIIKEQKTKEEKKVPFEKIIEYFKNE